MISALWPLRALAATACLASLTVGLVWWLAPALPDPTGRRFELFPLLAISMAPVWLGKWSPAIGISIYALVLASLVLASLLAVRLVWFGRSVIAARRLSLAMALASLVGCYFWFLREFDPWRASVLPWGGLLDPLAMLLGALSLVALVACFRIYPEPLTQELVQKGSESALRWQEAHAASKRSGRGIWRLWAWLPVELYGEYGAAWQPGLTGLRRVVRSRELLWVIGWAVAMIAMWWVEWPDGWRWPARTALQASMAALLVIALDPVAQARFDTMALRWLRRWDRRRIAAGEMRLHRFFGSLPGLVLVAAFALGLAVAWQHGNYAGFLAALLLSIAFILVLFGHALSLLLVNWQHGLREHRHAIAWILLGSLGAIALWAAGILASSLLRHVRWVGAERSDALFFGVLFGGAHLVVLAFVASLWAASLHRGGFDPALALRRGTGAATAGVMLTAAFVGLEGMLTSQVVVRLGMPDFSGALVAGTAAALLLAPLRRKVDQHIERAVMRWLPPEALADSERESGVVQFSDLSGYTRLSELDQDEALTLAGLLQRCAQEVVKRHGGRVVKSLGDAVLCVYPEPQQALGGVVELHTRYREAVEHRQLDELPLHSGLHQGDWVRARDGDVYGAAVNLAARLQGLAGEDEVVVSDRLSVALDSLGIESEYLPARRFKNIAEPVACRRFRVRALARSRHDARGDRAAG